MVFLLLNMPLSTHFRFPLAGFVSNESPIVNLFKIGRWFFKKGKIFYAYFIKFSGRVFVFYQYAGSLGHHF